MIKIYSMAYQDRSDRVRWLLEEMNVAYENVFLKKSQGDMQTPEYLKLNPLGRVPTIVDGTQVVFESGGIALYLADKYGMGRLAPEINSVHRAQYLQWMVFSVASLECVVARMFDFEGRSEADVQKIKGEVAKQCSILKLALNKTLAQQEFLLPSGFSAADIMMAAVIPGAADYLMEPGSPIEAYMKRMMQRPAAIKAQVFG